MNSNYYTKENFSAVYRDGNSTSSDILEDVQILPNIFLLKRYYTREDDGKTYIWHYYNYKFVSNNLETKTFKYNDTIITSLTGFTNETLNPTNPDNRNRLSAQILDKSQLAYSVRIFSNIDPLSAMPKLIELLDIIDSVGSWELVKIEYSDRIKIIDEKTLDFN
jgi:hypothetical protein